MIFYDFEKSTENEALKTTCPQTTVTIDLEIAIWKQTKLTKHFEAVFSRVSFGKSGTNSPTHPSS